MPSILVTGGAGFLGTHLVSALLDQQHDVTVIDSFWTGRAESLSRFKDRPGFKMVKHDVTQPFPTDLRADQVYHLACPASPTRFPENPQGILETCFIGTRNVLDFSLRCNARVLLASTSEVYGDPLVCPQAESYWGNVNPFGPRSCYDEGKRAAEALCYAYRLQHNVDTRIARIFNVYGPGMLPDDGRVVPNFIRAALNGDPIEITGDGKASRCFQFVTDCVDGLLALMDSPCESPVNIGSPVETTIRELADIVSRVVAEKAGQPRGVPVTLTPKREDDPFRRVPDVRLAKEKLNWEARVGLLEGLEATVDWFLAEDTSIHK